MVVDRLFIRPRARNLFWWRCVQIFKYSFFCVIVWFFFLWWFHSFFVHSFFLYELVYINLYAMVFLSNKPLSIFCHSLLLSCRITLQEQEFVMNETWLGLDSRLQPFQVTYPAPTLAPRSVGLAIKNTIMTSDVWHLNESATATMITKP